MGRVFRRLVWFCFALLLAGGCGSREAHREEGIVFWRPGFASKESRWAERAVKKIYSDVTFVDESTFPRHVSRMLKRGDVFVVDGATFPVSLWRHLESFIDEGGLAMFYGVDPFSQRFLLEGGRPILAEERQRQLIQNARPFVFMGRLERLVGDRRSPS